MKSLRIQKERDDRRERAKEAGISIARQHFLDYTSPEWISKKNLLWKTPAQREELESAKLAEEERLRPRSTWPPAPTAADLRKFGPHAEIEAQERQRKEEKAFGEVEPEPEMPGMYGFGGSSEGI